LMPFRNGAFAVAARAQMPVVPVAIRGTRKALGRHDIRGAEFGHRIGGVIAHRVHPAGEMHDGVRIAQHVGESRRGDRDEIAHRQHIRPRGGERRKRPHQAAERNACGAKVRAYGAARKAVGTGHHDGTGQRRACRTQNHFQPCRR